MKKLVHIKVSDKGWILEKLAREITNRLPYVSYGIESDSSAQIQYYMTYGCRHDRVSPVEIALFTHKEEVPSAAAKFDAVASSVDFCIAQSLNTESIIRNSGRTNVQTISPGVDLDKYTPRVRIGVVGRTYHTGRKGEKIVAQVMDIPGIEWHFTGEGWPGPAQYIPEDQLPQFYRSLDYVLVPALIEGGPMCVLEALASGCKVIASPVGWVPQFPHVEFKLGDADDLRRVLLDIVAEKNALRKSVEDYTWESWAFKHHALFTELLKQDPLNNNNDGDSNVNKRLPVKIKEDFRALVAVHGAEMTASLGGPSVRAPRTVAALKKLGVNADLVTNRGFAAENIDVVHTLNVWHPDECEALLREVEKNKIASVLSPIFLDLSELNFYNVRVRAALEESESYDEVKDKLSVICQENANHRLISLKDKEPFPNYFTSVRRLVSYANHLILLSEHEEKLLKEIGITHPSTSIIKNPVSTKIFEHGDAEMFREHIGVDEYVLCVGRIESRKNQALLALALRETTLPLVLIGHEADSQYAELVRKWGNSKVIFAGRIEPNSPMLASAFAGARVFCLPSWSEGAPLVALEAAAAGCNMVLSDRSAENEYFGDLARYVNPADVNDIKTKILEAWNDTPQINASKKLLLKKRIHSENSWDKYAVQTKTAYETALEIEYSKKESVPLVTKKHLYVDLTTLAHHNAPPTGIARVESRLADELHLFYGRDVEYIVWNSFYGVFLKVNYSHLINGEIKAYAGEFIPGFPPGKPQLNINFMPNSVVVIFGGAWIRNTNYLRDLQALKQIHGAAIVSTVYDVIQHKMKFLFPDGVGEQFALNCKEIISLSDKVLTCSEKSREDIVGFCLETSTPVCPISVFRLGDEAVHSDANSDIELQIESLAGLDINDKFVMFVSTIDVRKNHSLLLMLWKGLIKEYGDAVPKLVLVGSIGWRGNEAINILNANPELQEKVLMLHGIKDSTLDWLYKHCMFTVFPSRYEGWGLPVAESCRYGKFCLASDAGSLPEVAPGCAEYIDPLDCIEWYKALQKYCFDTELLAAKTALAKQYQVTNWHHTAQQVVDAIENVTTTIRYASLGLESDISFSTNSDEIALLSNGYTSSGWYQSETTGTWTSGKQAYFVFQYDEERDNDVFLTFAAFGYVPTTEAIDVSVFVNNNFATKWQVGAQVTNLVLPISSSLLSSSKNFIIRFDIANPKSPLDFGSADTRLLGLHVLSARFSIKPVDNSNLMIRGVNLTNSLVKVPRLTYKIINKLKRIRNVN